MIASLLCITQDQSWGPKAGKHHTWQRACSSAAHCAQAVQTLPILCFCSNTTALTLWTPMPSLPYLIHTLPKSPDLATIQCKLPTPGVARVALRECVREVSKDTFSLLQLHLGCSFHSHLKKLPPLGWDHTCVVVGHQSIVGRNSGVCNCGGVGWGPGDSGGCRRACCAAVGGRPCCGDA